MCLDGRRVSKLALAQATLQLIDDLDGWAQCDSAVTRMGSMPPVIMSSIICNSSRNNPSRRRRSDSGDSFVTAVRIATTVSLLLRSGARATGVGIGERLRREGKGRCPF
jgi:hypothetical protein